MTHGEEASRGNDLALVEAALFLASRPLTRRALAKILDDVPLSYVDQLLADLQGAYADGATGIELVLEEGRALLRVKAAYVDRVAHLAPQQDIPQPVLRTLAVIAYNHPATQADVVRTRGNKAYEHIQMLEDSDFVAREKYGRSFKLKLTPKFFEYFDVDNLNKLREQMQQQPKVEAPTQPEQNVEIPQPNNAEPNPANVQAEPEEQLPKSE